MPMLSIDRRDLLHPADEPDVWINLVGTFRRLDGITAEVLLDDLVCATHGVGSWGDGWARLTCVLDTTPARRVRRLAHAILVEHGARAEVEWSYELAPQLVERLGVADPRRLSWGERAIALTSRLVRRRG